MSNPFKNIQGETALKAPSNIALVKYWGKYGNQLPRNASISFTLNNAFTETSVKYTAKTDGSKNIDLKFLFEGQENAKFAEKIQKFLESIIPHFPFLPHFSPNQLFQFLSAFYRHCQLCFVNGGIGLVFNRYRKYTGRRSFPLLPFLKKPA